MESLNFLRSHMANLSAGELVVVSIAIAVIWFLPTIIALFRNPRHIGKIFLLNIPLGLTFTPWLILLAWSFNPNISFAQLKEKLGRAKKNKAKAQA